MDGRFRRARRAAYALLNVFLLACNSTSPTEPDTAVLAANGANSRFDVSPLDVSFGSTATTASVKLFNYTRKRISWTASENAGWLSLSATSGAIAARSTKTVSLSVQRGNLAAGTYTTKVSFATSVGSATVTVSMTVPTAPEKFDVAPLQVDFGATATSTSVTLKNNTANSVSWSASESAGWLGLSATSGTIAANSSKTLSLSGNRIGLTAGTYSTSLKVSAGTAGADTASVKITVPSPSDVTLAGQLVHQFNGTGLGGLTVQYDGRSTTTDGAGFFTIVGDATSNLQQLTISGSGVYKRMTFARTGDIRWRVVPSGFDMQAFNDVARDEFGPGTVRWITAPKVYIDSRPEGFTSAEISTWISEVKAQVPAFIQDWTGNQISPASITVTSSPPSDYTDGTIVIHFSENAADYDNTASIGYARLKYGSTGSIGSAAIWLRYLVYSGSTKAGKRKGILGHELGHAIGLGHMSLATESLMQPSLGTRTGLLAFDVQAASFHYTRSPENTHPDTDDPSAYDRALSPAALPQERTWVCFAGTEN